MTVKKIQIWCMFQSWNQIKVIKTQFIPISSQFNNYTSNKIKSLAHEQINNK